MHVQYSLNYNTQIKYFRTYVDIFLFWYVELMPKFRPQLSFTFCIATTENLDQSNEYTYIQFTHEILYLLVNRCSLPIQYFGAMLEHLLLEILEINRVV
jgi:hypothetical protein